MLTKLVRAFRRAPVIPRKGGRTSPMWTVGSSLGRFLRTVTSKVVYTDVYLGATFNVTIGQTRPGSQARTHGPLRR